MKAKLTLLLSVILFASLVYSQTGVVNNGARLVIKDTAILFISGGIDSANYVNKTYDSLDLGIVVTHGRIELDNLGKIRLQGNWLDSAASGNVISISGTSGEVFFDDAGIATTHTIGGTNDDYFAFDKIYIDNLSTVEIDENINVTLNDSLKNDGSLKIKSSATGTASFIDNGKITGSGSAEVQLYLTNADRYYYVSPPISDAAPNDEFATAADLYEYNTSISDWSAISTESFTPLTVGQGYAVKYASPGQTVSFTGALNTGGIGLPVADEGNNWHLVGNPYPSTLNWDDVTLSEDVSTTIYYRTKHTSNTTRVFETYNSTSQTGTDNNGDAINATQYIQGMQAFWVKVTGVSPSISVANSDRSHYSQLFYKDDKSANKILRLKVSNDIYTDETIIYFFRDATYRLDDYDSEKRFVDNENIPQLYTVIPEDIQLVMNGLPLLTDDLAVPLGFKTEIEGEFTITASDFEELVESTYIYLEDLMEGVLINLRSSDYSFTSGPVYDADRFVVHFLTEHSPSDDLTSDGEATEIEEISFELNIYSYEDNIYVKCTDPDNLEAQIIVINMMGQELLRKELENTTLNRINFNGQNSNYLIRIISKDKLISKVLYIK